MEKIEEHFMPDVPEEKQTIVDLFLQQVAKNHQKLAVVDDQASITYEQLAGIAGCVAREIVKKTGRDAARICILAQQNIYAVVGILGVLMSGKCFVPMLPQENDNYLRYLWENSEASLIVCSPQDATRAASICGDLQRVIICERVCGRADIFDSSGYSNKQENISAIMYTSGTTGQPKGVMTTESAILNRALQHLEMANLTSSDRQASVIPWQFAASYPDIFAPLITGAALYMYDSYCFGIERLGLWLKENSITLLKLPSALFSRFIENVSADLLGYVRYIYLSGGALKVENAKTLLNMLPENAILMHGFGSTETNLLAKMEWRRTDAVFQAFNREDTLPAGYPVAGKKIQIVDEKRDPVDLGQEGELAVISRDIFHGYWKQPEMTRRYLKELPTGERIYYTGDLGRIREDGCLEIIGRKDNRVKIRGLRINLEAVEDHLRSLPYVCDAAVISFSVEGREAQMVAYLEPKGKEPPTITMIWNDLTKIAPAYMIPSRFVLMDALPRTASGKIDRNSLPPPGRQRPLLANAYQPPRNDLEKYLADIWADVLDIEEVGIYDNFMELGGDSLVALELEARIQNEIGVKQPIERLLQALTIAQMAKMIYSPGSLNLSPRDVRAPFRWRIKYFRRKIKNRLIWFSARIGSFTPPYKYLIMAQKFWISLPITRFLLRRRTTPFKEWLTLLGEMDESGELMTNNLMANTLCSLRNFFLAQEKNLNHWIKTTGWEYAKNAAAAGKGAIFVNPHTRIFFPCVREYLTLKIFPQIYFLGQKGLSPDKIAKTIGLTKRLKEARAVLENGGAVWVSGDGQQGKEKIVLKRFGRRFPFRAGVADLAVRTDTPLIPVFPILKPDGSVQVEFCGPLVSTKGGSRAERAEDILNQYAKIYVDHWVRVLPNIKTGRQKRRLHDFAQ